MTAKATSIRNRPVRNNHRQVWIKVNADVDAGIVRLVEALSSFPQLRTTSSCQGNPPRGAEVTFVYGEHVYDGWKALAEFVVWSKANREAWERCYSMGFPIGPKLRVQRSDPFSRGWVQFLHLHSQRPRDRFMRESLVYCHKDG